MSKQSKQTKPADKSGYGANPRPGNSGEFEVAFSIAGRMRLTTGDIKRIAAISIVVATMLGFGGVGIRELDPNPVEDGARHSVTQSGQR